MSKLSAALVAAVFTTSALTGTPALAERGYDRHERGYHVTQGHPGNYRGHGNDGWAIGLGLLAGTAILLAATQPRPVIGAPPVVVYPNQPVIYVPPVPTGPAYSNPNSQWWYYCAQPAGYYPYVAICPTGWARVAPRPPG